MNTKIINEIMWHTQNKVSSKFLSARTHHSILDDKDHYEDMITVHVGSFSMSVLANYHKETKKLKFVFFSNDTIMPFETISIFEDIYHYIKRTITDEMKCNSDIRLQILLSGLEHITFSNTDIFDKLRKRNRFFKDT